MVGKIAYWLLGAAFLVGGAAVIATDIEDSVIEAVKDVADRESFESLGIFPPPTTPAPVTVTPNPVRIDSGPTPQVGRPIRIPAPTPTPLISVVYSTPSPAIAAWPTPVNFITYSTPIPSPVQQVVTPTLPEYCTVSEWVEVVYPSRGVSMGTPIPHPKASTPSVRAFIDCDEGAYRTWEGRVNGCKDHIYHWTATLTHHGERIEWEAETSAGCERNIWGNNLPSIHKGGSSISVRAAKRHVEGFVARMIIDEHGARAIAAAEATAEAEEFNRRQNELKRD